MIIRTEKTNYLYAPAQLRYKAYKALLFYRYGANEIALDNYLQKEFKANLKILVHNLFYKSKTVDNGDEFITYFSSKNADIWARLITYGNLEVKGSSILKDSFYARRD